MNCVVQYNVLPLENREHNSKQDSILSAKYKNSCKRVTLNERFGVIEKGYVLEAIDTGKDTTKSPVQLIVHERNLISKKDFVEKYLAKNSGNLVGENFEDKENAPMASAKKQSESEKEVFTTYSYVQEVSKNILGSI